MTIKVTKYTKSNSEGALVAYFSILIDTWGNFFINDMKLFQKNGRRWCSFPDKKYQKDGEDKYSPYCGFAERGMSDKFVEQLLKAIDQFALEQGQMPKEEKMFDEVPF